MNARQLIGSDIHGRIIRWEWKRLQKISRDTYDTMIEYRSIWCGYVWGKYNNKL
jgi:hypothetical protein